MATAQPAPPSRLETAKTVFHWTARTVVAILVTYAFIVVLLVATAQQKVDDALTKEAVGYDYSVAVRYYFGRDNLKHLVGENSEAIKQSTAQLRAANDRLQSANRNLAAEAADHLLEVAQVATVPGSVFGEHGEGHLRFSFSTSPEIIRAGLNSLRRNL